MNLDFNNNLFNNLKENDFVQNFIRELSNIIKNNKISNDTDNWNNLSEDDLELYGEKITVKFKEKMLIERNNILQQYSQNTQEKGEMYYIYDMNSRDINSYNLENCEQGKSHEIIQKNKKELPEGVTLGSVLRKRDVGFALDVEGTKNIREKINTMIKEKIAEQHEYLESKRVEGHTYEVGEKYNGRIWLYDLDNIQGGGIEGIEGIEEIKFPKDLYQNAKEGDLFVYKNGEYEKK